MALQALINPGDEVLVPDPGFLCYEPCVNIADGMPVSIPLLEKDGFKVDEQIVISHITDKARMAIVNTPNNPTDAIFEHDDLSKFARVEVERDPVVISDEVCEKITYGYARHFCLAGSLVCANGPLLLVLFLKPMP